MVPVRLEIMGFKAPLEKVAANVMLREAGVLDTAVCF